MIEDPVTEALVMAFIELIQETKAKGRNELTATWETVAAWLSRRSGLTVLPRHVGILADAMAQGGIITVGGGGIGSPNTYDTREKQMGINRFWEQVEAFIQVWHHPSRKRLMEPQNSEESPEQG
jgi:hypothetical protein